MSVRSDPCEVHKSKDWCQDITLSYELSYRVVCNMYQSTVHQFDDNITRVIL